MAFHKPIDNLAVTLAESYVAGSNTLVVSDGSLFGDVSEDGSVYLCVFKKTAIDTFGRVVAPEDSAQFEVVGREGDSLVVTPCSSSFEAGSPAYGFLTADHLTELQEAITTLQAGAGGSSLPEGGTAGDLLTTDGADASWTSTIAQDVVAGLPDALGRGERRLRIISTGNSVLNNGLSNGTDTSATTGVLHQLFEDTYGVRLLYANVNTQNDIDSLGPNDLTIKCSIEYPHTSGTVLPLYFDGQRSITLKPGEWRLTDPIMVRFEQGQYIRSRTYVEVEAGGKWPRTALISNYDKGVDLSDGGTMTSYPYNGYSPIAVLGDKFDVDPVSLLVFGDSINTENGGWLTAAIGGGLRQNVPNIWHAVAGRDFEAYSPTFPVGVSKSGWIRLLFAQYCKYAVVALGANDHDADTFEELLGRARLTWRALRAQGARVIACTITPKTTSTDEWATLAGQSIPSDAFYQPGGPRTTYNDYLRDPANLQAEGLWGVFDPADRAESSRNSCKWAVPGSTNATGDEITSAMTTDGLHPADVGNTDSFPNQILKLAYDSSLIV